jgi:hypothetical protein
MQHGVGVALLAALVICSAFLTTDASPVPAYEERWFDQAIDHFTFGQRNSSAPSSFKQRYLLNDTFWKPGAPWFFYGELHIASVPSPRTAHAARGTQPQRAMKPRWMHTHEPPASCGRTPQLMEQ